MEKKRSVSAGMLVRETMKGNAVFGVAVLGILLVGGATVVFAHHAMSHKYDIGKRITIEGTLTEVVLGNPHSFLFLDAKPVDQPNAPVKNWSVEAPNIGRLARGGWQQDTIKAGYKVKITGYPRRDGQPQVAFIAITDDHGHEFNIPNRLPNAVAGPLRSRDR